MMRETKLRGETLESRECLSGGVVFPGADPYPGTPPSAAWFDEHGVNPRLPTDRASALAGAAAAACAQHGALTLPARPVGRFDPAVHSSSMNSIGRSESRPAAVAAEIFTPTADWVDGDLSSLVKGIRARRGR